MFNCIGHMFVYFADDEVVVTDAAVGSHGKVGDSCKGGDKGCDDVEEAFLLGYILASVFALSLKDRER